MFLEIDIEHAIECVIAHAHEQAIAGDAGVVDERPNGTKVVEDRFHARVDSSGIGHVALICACRGANRLTGFARLARRIDAAGIDDGDIKAVLRQTDSAGAADTREPPVTSATRRESLRSSAPLFKLPMSFLSGCSPVDYASSSAIAATCSAVSHEYTRTSLSVRLTRPDSVLPGPTSINVSMP